ncbi:Mushroom body large-type Kenyon cell-specific protein 1 [Fasciola hepatica]|uniref:Mushroom body large-type Kenyon cell-specific protein 1 n=1 Tax=Fasciola hepatica TaxID=6192 RepID=A0A4E0RBQ2_FASHE|nr:Mushroom body large-type Kenyon cell-specific protein 1 [Fasciola hepatica]
MKNQLKFPIENYTKEDCSPTWHQASKTRMLSTEADCQNVGSVNNTKSLSSHGSLVESDPGKTESFGHRSTIASSNSFCSETRTFSDRTGLASLVEEWDRQFDPASKQPQLPKSQVNRIYCKDSGLDNPRGLRRNPTDFWWTTAHQESCLESGGDEPLDLSLKRCSMHSSAKPSGSPNQPPVYGMNSEVGVWKGFPAGTSVVNESDYMNIWRSLCFQQFRTVVRDNRPSEFGSPSTLMQQIHHHYHHHQAATRTSQSIIQEKPIAKEFPASYLYKLGRMRRLMNYYSATMNKPIARQTTETGASVTQNVGESVDSKPSRRPYTEAELAAAVRAICFDRLGTRRAASVYGIPRSTLRNKICKLNELKKREEERLGGKSIVMADFLHSLIRAQNNETEMSNCRWPERAIQLGQIKTTPRATVDDPERLFRTATHVASIFQVNCRKSYGNRNLNEMRYAFGSRGPSRLPVGRTGRISVDSKKQADLHRVLKLNSDKSHALETKGKTRHDLTVTSPAHQSRPGSSVPCPHSQTLTGFTTSSCSAFNPVPSVTKAHSHSSMETREGFTFGQDCRTGPSFT